MSFYRIFTKGVIIIYYHAIKIKKYHLKLHAIDFLEVKFEILI